MKKRGCFEVKKRVFLEHSMRLQAKSADIKNGGKQCNCKRGEQAFSFVRGLWASLRGNGLRSYLDGSGPLSNPRNPHGGLGPLEE